MVSRDWICPAVCVRRARRFSAHPAPSTLSSLRVRPHGQCFQRMWRPYSPPLVVPLAWGVDVLYFSVSMAGSHRRPQSPHRFTCDPPTYPTTAPLGDPQDRHEAFEIPLFRIIVVSFSPPAILLYAGRGLPHQGSSALRAEFRITAGLAAARGARHPTKIRCCDRNTFPPDCNNRLRADFVYFDEPVPPHENRVTRRSKINRVRTPINPKNGPLTAVGPGAHQFLRELPRQILFPQISLSFQFLFQHFRLPSPYSTPPPPPPTPPPPGPPCCSPSACRP